MNMERWKRSNAWPGRLALRGRYWLTRFLFYRFLGLMYCVAFLCLAQQLGPLIGSDGLLPADHYLNTLAAVSGKGLASFLARPTVFWFDCSDTFLYALAYAGLALSLLLLLGCANAPLLALLWFLYLSFYHIGQLFYAYGWEVLLLETGFLAIFLCPLWDPRPFSQRSPPPKVVIWLLRWVLFRVMFGAGLIKLRGDPCWRELTCMLYHYETQPLPNPVSWYLHQLPPIFHSIEVLGNHFVELIVPWTLFAPRRLRQAGGLFLVGFQILLIISGNLSWLNWLTLTLCISCFDDQALSRLLPKRLRDRALAMAPARPGRVRRYVTYSVTALILYLSLGPVRNLLGPRQVMNGSFDRLHLVNTYGAFGRVSRRRREVILEGTYDRHINASTRWRAYEFKCKPGDVSRRPCVVAPYQYRLDWQMWFAALSNYRRNPWLVLLVSKLLRGDEQALSLLATSPFRAGPPRFIRAELYEYKFTHFGDKTGAWWTRNRLGTYLPPLSLDNRALKNFLQRFGERAGG